MVESKLDFTFSGQAIKFDDTKFYEIFKNIAFFMSLNVK